MYALHLTVVGLILTYKIGITTIGGVSFFLFFEIFIMKSVLVDVSYPDEGIKTNILYYGLPKSVKFGFHEYDFYIHSNTMSSFWKKVIRFQRNMRKAGILCENFNYRNAHPEN